MARATQYNPRVIEVTAPVLAELWSRRPYGMARGRLCSRPYRGTERLLVALGASLNFFTKISR